MEINVKILCQSRLVAEGLKCLLEHSEAVAVSAASSSFDDLASQSPSSCDVLVVDAESSREIFDQLDRLGNPHVLLISNKVDGPVVFDDLRGKFAAGLSGVLATDSDQTLFNKAILKISAGELWLDHMTLSKSLTKRDGLKRHITLTKKETEVLECVCSGDTNKKIAQKLSISEQTVKSHCNHLFKKFGVENRVKLVLIAAKMVGSGKERGKMLQ